MPRLCAWFEKVSKLPFVASNAGFISIKSAGAENKQPKKGADKPKPEKKEAKKEDDNEEFDPFGEDDEEDAVSDIEDLINIIIIG